MDFDDAENRSILIDNDHMYLGIALDRTQLPTSSTADAEDWLEVFSTEITDGTYADGQVNLFYFDIVSEPSHSWIFPWLV